MRVPRPILVEPLVAKALPRRNHSRGRSIKVFSIIVALGCAMLVSLASCTGQRFTTWRHNIAMAGVISKHGRRVVNVPARWWMDIRSSCWRPLTFPARTHGVAPSGARLVNNMCAAGDTAEASDTVKINMIDERRLLNGENAIGPTVVLLHGLDSWHGTWNATVDMLKQRGIGCITLDLRGHGLSPLGDPRTFGPRSLAADIRAALLRVGVLSGDESSRNKLVLVGHSMGGRVALRYTAAYPDDINALVIEDMDCSVRTYSANYLEPTPDEIRRKQHFSRSSNSWSECRESLLSFGYDAARVDSWLREEPPRVFPVGDDGSVWSAVNPYAQWLARRTVLTHQDSYEALQRISTIRARGRADLAVHVLVADPEKTVCSWQAQPGGLTDMAAVLPGLNIKTYPNRSHSIHNSDTQAFVDTIQSICQKCVDEQ